VARSAAFRVTHTALDLVVGTLLVSYATTASA
jgi:hypothetical protein